MSEIGFASWYKPFHSWSSRNDGYSERSSAYSSLFGSQADLTNSVYRDSEPKGGGELALDCPHGKQADG